MSEKYSRAINDDVCGSIELSEAEWDIINTQAFQRLRRIRQLGLSSFVFPSAEHSRFTHSLGVLFIMGRMAEYLKKQGVFDDDEVRRLRMAALLHDIGHYPLSHAGEAVYVRIEAESESRSILEKETQEEGDGEESQLTKAARKYRGKIAHHERLGAEVITKRPEITRILKRHKFDPEELAKIINGEHAEQVIYNLLMHSSLDADRLDYMVRDARHTGVQYGMVDVDYLIRSLRIGEEKDANGRLVKVIGVHRKALHVLEHYLTARYFLYSQVIFHKTVLAFETLAKSLLYEAAKEGVIHKNFRAICDSVASPEFIDFDDGLFFRLLEDNRLRKKRLFAVIAERLRRRLRPKLLKEIKHLSNRDRGTQPSGQYAVLAWNLKKQPRQLAHRLRIPFEWLFYQELSLDFENIYPYFSISKPLSEEDKKEAARVVEDDGSARLLVEDESSVIHHLSLLKLDILRLYSLHFPNEYKEASKRLEHIRSSLEGFINT